MSTRTIQVAAPRLLPTGPPMPWSAEPSSTADKLTRITALGQRIDQYVQFMSRVGNDNGVSEDVRERAIQGFYVQLVAAERALGHRYEQFRLE